MKNLTAKISLTDLYKPGLDRKNEAVISDHFMHNINRDLNLTLYSQKDFSEKALALSSTLIMERLIPALLEASNKFILERITAAKNRVLKKKDNYKLNTKEVERSEIITELLLDRQFLKGSKSQVSRLSLSNKIYDLIERNQPINMVIPALPYKSSSPLKSRGSLPDLAELNFLISLVEIAKAVALIYSEEQDNLQKEWAKFTIISDGSRFNHFLNEPDETLKEYQNKLVWWINKLQLANYVEIVDYQWLLSNYLPSQLYLQKIAIRKKAHRLYSYLMNPLFNPYEMQQTLRKAIESDPEPESSNEEARYVPLFKSLIYIINYKTLADYTKLHHKNYVDLYTELTKHIFIPYTLLTVEDEAKVAQFISKTLKEVPPKEHLLEFLRQSMLKEAWNAAINYIAEIKSDRDLEQEPIATCFPDHIRWTIHAKPGQLAILTTSAFGELVQAWHGAGVLKLTKNNKIKLYTLPILVLEGEGAIPVTINQDKKCRLKEQPFFYIYPGLHFENIEDLMDQIKYNLTRKRKI